MVGGTLKKKKNNRFTYKAVTVISAFILNTFLITINTINILEDFRISEVVNSPLLEFERHTAIDTKKAEIISIENLKNKNAIRQKETEAHESTKNTNKHDQKSNAEDNKNSNTSLQKSKKSARYAYNFVLGGIHESQPAYKGFLYNILISVNLLKKLGSEADFWVWAQLSPNSTLD